MKTMRRIVSVMLAAALILGLCTCALASGVKTFETTANVNMRVKANANSSWITTVPKGTEFEATDACVDVKGTTWYYGSYGKKSGWVCGKYLSDGSSGGSSGSAQTMTTTGSVNMRASASTSGTKRAVLPKGTSFTATDSKTDSRGVTWYYGSYGGKTGWVSGKYLTASGSSSSSSSKKTTTGNVNMRKTPSTSGTKVTVVPKGASVTVTDSKTDSRGVTWYYLTYGGKSGWISGKYVKSN